MNAYLSHRRAYVGREVGRFAERSVEGAFQYVEIEWLVEIRAYPPLGEAKRFFGVGGSADRDDDGRRGKLSDCVEDIEAGAIGQLQIEHHQIWLEARE